MKKLLLIITIFFLCSSVGFAGTINVESPYSSTEVQAAIDASSSGCTWDTCTVYIPTGVDATWDVTIELNKNITLMGAGSSVTKVTFKQTGAGSAINYSGASFRITGIGFIAGVGSEMIVGAYANNWRVDHCSFIYNADGLLPVVGKNALVVQGGPDHPGFGLWDSNTMTDVRVVVYGDTCGPEQNTKWANAIGAGSANAVYVENNTIINGGHAAATIPDGNCGERIVYRYNTMNGYGTAFHGNQSGGQRGSRLWEVYNNVYTSDGYATFVPLWFRGGTGYVYNNTIGDGFSYNINYMDNQRSRGTGGIVIECDGTAAEDGNRSGQSGYPCRDQIGRSTDSWQWTSGNPNPPQALSPAYFWNNLHGSTIVDADLDYGHALETSQIVENRDFYNEPASFDGTVGVGKGLVANRPATCTTGAETGGGVGYWATDENKLYRCSATNTWAEQYAPYTCPHPLTGLTEGCSSTAGLAGYNTSGEADTTAPAVTITTADPSAISTDALTITGTASDAVGVSSCKYRIGSAPDAGNGTACTGTTSWSCSTTGYSSGANTAYVGCTDTAANWGAGDSITVNYTPTATITLGGSGTITIGGATGLNVAVGPWGVMGERRPLHAQAQMWLDGEWQYLCVDFPAVSTCAREPEFDPDRYYLPWVWNIERISVMAKENRPK